MSKQDFANGASMYRAMVIDSGPIIKNSAVRSLFGKATLYYTTPAVIQEIRDAKARQSLEQLPFELLEKEPTSKSLDSVIEFAKQTGDYPSLSTVDLQVLALCLDLEREGCPDLDHIRTTPKRVIGLGPLQNLNGESVQESKRSEDTELHQGTGAIKLIEEEETKSQDDQEHRNSFFTTPPETFESPLETTLRVPSPPKSWAHLVNPDIKTTTLSVEENNLENLQSLTLSSPEEVQDEGIFDDAEEGVNERSPRRLYSEKFIQQELQLEFPSLSAAATVPYEGSDEEDVENEKQEDSEFQKDSEEEARERKKQEALKPISKSGKMYNSFRKYGDLMKSAPPRRKTKPATSSLLNLAQDEEKSEILGSRIVGTGSAGIISDMTEEDDDGEGWISCKNDIQSGRLGKKLNKEDNDTRNLGPPTTKRTACTTTDFAMQNVLLQMGLSLLTVDGMKVRRLKSWVHRCGACFRVHTDAEFEGMRRLFCSHCGSDMMQRIAASVDGSTGRLKLHLKKNYKHNLRGTKFSLPKSGSVSGCFPFLLFA